MLSSRTRTAATPGITELDAEITHDNTPLIINSNLNGTYDLAFPNTTRDIVPNWLEVPAKYTLGVLTKYVDPVLGLETVIDEFAEKNGWWEISNGYKFRHGQPWYAIWGGWGSAGIAVRFQVRVPKDISSEVLTIKTNTHRDKIYATETGSYYRVTFTGDKTPPAVYSDGTCIGGSDCEIIS